MKWLFFLCTFPLYLFGHIQFIAHREETHCHFSSFVQVLTDQGKNARLRVEDQVYAKKSGLILPSFQLEGASYIIIDSKTSTQTIQQLRKKAPFALIYLYYTSQETNQKLVPQKSSTLAYSDGVLVQSALPNPYLQGIFGKACCHLGYYPKNRIETIQLYRKAAKTSSMIQKNYRDMLPEKKRIFVYFIEKENAALLQDLTAFSEMIEKNPSYFHESKVLIHQDAKNKGLSSIEERLNQLIERRPNIVQRSPYSFIEACALADAVLYSSCSFAADLALAGLPLYQVGGNPKSLLVQKRVAVHIRPYDSLKPLFSYQREIEIPSLLQDLGYLEDWQDRLLAFFEK